MLAASLIVACGDDPSSSSTTASGGSSSSTGQGGSGADGGTGSASGGAGGSSSSSGGTGGGGGGGGGLPTAECAPLPAPEGAVVMAGPNDDIDAMLDSAQPGDTIMLAAGNYDMSGRAIWVDTAGVTIRGATGNPEDVVLDGGYDTPGGGLVNVRDAGDVTIADLTIRRSRYHAVHITASNAATNNTLLYNLRVFDPGEQAIKINTGGNGFYTDEGEIACSHIELTQPGREQVMSYAPAGLECYTGGIDAHQSRDWLVRDNTIVGFWCSNDFISEHAIHFWRGSRDTVVVRNYLIDNVRGIGFGLSGWGRTYGDNPCPNATDVGHYGGEIYNNFIVATDPNIFASPSGVDSGIALWYSCNVTAAHNTVAFSQAPFSGIEYRFDSTNATLVNNLTTHSIRERQGASASAQGNMTDVATSTFADLNGFDLHLAQGSAAIGAGTALGGTLAPEDIDGDSRAVKTPDVGADQLP